MPSEARVARHSRATAACMSSPGLREVPGAAPEGDRLEDRALRLGPGVDRGPPGDLEGRALVVAGEGAEGRRRVGRAEGGQADLRRRLAERVGGDHQAVDVRHLALVGRHAVGGVALDVLDRAHALADREADVLGGDVVLEVDEGLGLRRRCGRSAAPCSVTPEPVRSPVDGVGLRLGLAAGVAGGLGAGGGAVGERGGDAPEAAAGAGDVDGLGLLAGQEGLAARRPRRGCPWCGRRGAGRASSRRTSAPRRRRCRARRRPCRSRTRLTRSDFTRSRPEVPVTVRPSRASMPRARARSVRAGSTAGRTSTMAAGLAPASARSKAASQALSWAVTIAGRSPTLTP